MKLFSKLLILLLVFTVSYSQDAVKSKELYLDIEKYPKRVFTGQKFEILLKATILKPTDSYDDIIVSFLDGKNIEIIDNNPVFQKTKENIYFAKLTFKTKDKEFVLPKVTVGLTKEQDIVDFLSINLPKIKFEKIAVNEELFSNIIAKDLQVLTVKTKQFDNNTLHSTINIEAVNSNLEDIYLKKYKDQGIKSFKENYPFSNIFFYVMTPVHIKNLKFTYYNTVSKEFVTVNIPIALKEDLVSTQTDLNPYNSSLLLYKQYLSIFFVTLFLILLIITKREKYFYLSGLMIIVVAYLYLPNKKVVLKKGTAVYILPTKNSTVYKELEKRYLVEILDQKDNFNKVLFQNHNTGWIKNNDIK